MTLGEKLQKLRKERGYSQEVLAEKIGVTRQTISKWELNQSLPDLDFVGRLCEVFHVSADYLINGEVKEITESVEERGRRKYDRFWEEKKDVLFALVTALAIVASCICLISDYFLGEGLSWSPIALLSTMGAWLLFLPLFKAKTKVLFKTLIVLSAISIPFLGLLSVMLRKPGLLPLGTCLALIAIVGIWGIYGIFKKMGNRPWRALGYALLLLIPLAIAITRTVSWMVPEIPVDSTSEGFHAAITLGMALLCFLADYLRGRGRKEEKR